MKAKTPSIKVKLVGLLAALVLGYLGLGDFVFDNIRFANGDPKGCLVAAPPIPKDANKVGVSRIVDGDTFELPDKTKVRLIGINTPESVDPRRPVEYYGKEASKFTQRMLLGKWVYLKPGQTKEDRYGRLLAFVWLEDGTFYNAFLVRQGYAQVATYKDNPEHAKLFRFCEKEAREAERGLWAKEPK